MDDAEPEGVTEDGYAVYFCFDCARPIVEDEDGLFIHDDVPHQHEWRITHPAPRSYFQ